MMVKQTAWPALETEPSVMPSRPINRDGAVWKRLAAGLAGGLAGTWLMSQFQKLRSAAAERGEDEKAETSGERSAEQSSGDGDNGQESPTVKVARAISRRVLRRDLAEGEREPASTAVSYAFGTAMGAVYGVAVEVVPEARAGAGLAFGAALWAGADEGMVPALGLSGSPLDEPPTAHIFGLASHLVYGLGTEAVRRIVRRLLH